MKTIKVNSILDIHENYTGILECPNGDKLWYLNGKFHRLDGPSVELCNGYKFWYLNGKEYTFEQYWNIQKNTEHANKIMAYILSGDRE